MLLFKTETQTMAVKAVSVPTATDGVLLVVWVLGLTVGAGDQVGTESLAVAHRALQLAVVTVVLVEASTGCQLLDIPLM